MPEALQDRLRRLRRGDDAGPPTVPRPGGGAGPESLDRLEESLLGEKAPLLSIKERLQRLVSVTAQRTRPVVSWPALEELAPGRPVTNARGEFFLSEVELPMDHRHGEVVLSRL